MLCGSVANWVGVTAASCCEQVLLSGSKSQKDHCCMFEKELCVSFEGQQKTNIHVVVS